MSNGLREMLYGGGYAAPAAGPHSGGGFPVGAQFGFNVGDETFRVQIAIAGLFLAAIAGLMLLHKYGNRFSVKV